MMSEERRARTEEEKRIDRRSFFIGIFIAMAIIALFTILYLAGYMK